MAYITKGMNFILKNIYGGYETFGGMANASIVYYPPFGITIDHFRVALYDVKIYFDIKVNKIKGKFRQYDAANNLLSETSIEVTRGSSVTIPASEGVDYVELFITYYETYNSSSITRDIGVDVLGSGIGSEVIRIATEDSANNETSSVRLTSYKVITLAKAFEIVQVIGEQPTRVFSITTTNTNLYIKQWAIEITGLSGSADPNVDRVYLQLLDVGDNVLASVDVGVAVGNIAFLDHNTATAKIRVYLSTTKRLIVTCRVHELVNIAYGVP